MLSEIKSSFIAPNRHLFHLQERQLTPIEQRVGAMLSLVPVDNRLSADSKEFRSLLQAISAAHAAASPPQNGANPESINPAGARLSIPRLPTRSSWQTLDQSAAAVTSAAPKAVAPDPTARARGTCNSLGRGHSRLSFQARNTGGAARGSNQSQLFGSCKWETRGKHKYQSFYEKV